MTTPQFNVINKNSASAEVADRKMFVNKTRKHENTKLADRKVLRPLRLTGASSPRSGGIRTSV